MFVHFRLTPTKEQEIMLNRTFCSCRFVYNYYVGKKIELYKVKATLCLMLNVLNWS
ncbi:helix-turn-helix domain-containing protein [Clostridium polyendosporum]|uniref:helix-turn-helix domain-containing protein n=1 Tax=Clostridium polyendosporum TaxID=69208 RepID=UPI003898E82D